MFGILLFDVLFLAIPIALIVLLGVSLYHYLYAKKQNKTEPGTFSDGEIKKRKITLIILSVIAGVFAAIVIGFIALMFMAVAFM
ncbi:MAG: hypothetical protein E7597_00245 [Ruminococcaceae bacterium]|nr:hypothetical protein [Oscillospiraceae bacterium]